MASAEEAPKEEDVKMDDVKQEEEKKEDEKTEPMKEDEKTEPMKEDEKAEPMEAEPTEFEDAAEDKLPRLGAAEVALDIASATPNAMPSADGRMLFTLCDGGFQHLLAGVRTNVGLKAGCYAFEVRILELLSPHEGRSRDSRASQPRQTVRLGFSVAGGSAVLDDDAGKFYFDADGGTVSGGSYSKVGGRFSRDQYVAVVLNLGGQPFANTVSLFVDGRRACPPQPLPESMVGQVLYPSVTYRNVTLQVNLGPALKKPLPFKCRALKDVSAEHAELSKVVAPQSGRHEVLVPVGLPEQGAFDWLDQFREANPRHIELSDREVLKWAQMSGLPRPRGYAASNDKPGLQIGVSSLDDGSVQSTLSAVAPALRRDFIAMELKGNLLATERKQLLARFPASDFKRVAVVVMGEPPKDYKERVQGLVLADKKTKAAKEKDRGWRGKRWEENEEKKTQDSKAEDATEEGSKAEAEEEKPVELTPEELAQWHRKQDTPDLTPADLAASFADFTLPEEAEGFDEIRYVWQEAATCAETLRSWVLDQKRTQRVEDLQPSAWFKEKVDAWNAQLAEWQKKQSEAQQSTSKQAEGEKKEGEDADGAGKPAGELDEDDIDPFTHENVDDMGNGKPLYVNFVYEDWTLLSTRVELHLLVHAFRKDLNDPDRPSFHESHLSFYLDKYFGKRLDLKQFGVEKLEDLVALVKDTVTLDAQTSFVNALRPEDESLDKFLRHTEDHRRERQRCVDAGDETAVLKFSRPAPPPPRGQGHGGSRQTYGGDRGRGGDYHRGGNRNDRGGQQGASYGQRGGYGGDRAGYNSRGGGAHRGGDNRGGGGYGDRGGHHGGGAGGSRGSYGGGSSYGSNPAVGGGPNKRPPPPGPPPAAYPPAKQSRYGDSRGAPLPRGGGGGYGGGRR